VPPKLDIQQVKAILTTSDLIASWQVLIEEETRIGLSIKSAAALSEPPMN
jgi:hypothetical protein